MASVEIGTGVMTTFRDSSKAGGFRPDKSEVSILGALRTGQTQEAGDTANSTRVSGIAALKDFLLSLFVKHSE